MTHHPSSDDPMTRRERQDLAQLVRRRGKLAKANVDHVAAERLADFEEQLGSVYAPADDPVWLELHAAANEVVEQAEAGIAKRCEELGIPRRCAPKLQLGWYGRGENAFADRRAELRKVATTRIAADGKQAKAEIERRSLEVQEQLLVGGLESAEARAFVESMPKADELMPPISVAEVERTGQVARKPESDDAVLREARLRGYLGTRGSDYLGTAEDERA
jgi:hypothetical protein